MGGACGMHGRDKKCTHNFSEKIKRAETTQETQRWENNIKMDLKEIAYEGVEWNHVAQGRNQLQPVVYMIMNLQVP
jgi:hypothetical protein